jgi:hypothetical protein
MWEAGVKRHLRLYASRFSWAGVNLFKIDASNSKMALQAKLYNLWGLR